MSSIDKIKQPVKIAIAVLLPVSAIIVLLYIKYGYSLGEGISCFTNKYLGVYCMGCGTTRQLSLLLEGDVKNAFMQNVGAVIIYPAYFYLYYLVLRWAVWDKKIKPKQAYVLAVFAGIMIIYMILRNIPLDAFDILRP